jgi:hypothetical protein
MEHVTLVGQKKNYSKIFLGNPEGRDGWAQIRG